MGILNAIRERLGGRKSQTFTKTEEHYRFTVEQAHRWFDSTMRNWPKVPRDCPLTFTELCEVLQDDTAQATTAGPFGLPGMGPGAVGTYAGLIKLIRASVARYYDAGRRGRA